MRDDFYDAVFWGFVMYNVWTVRKNGILVRQVQKVVYLKGGQLNS